MTAILLSLALLSLVSVAGMAALSATVGRPGTRDGRVDPFLPGVADPSADTLHGEADVPTVFVEAAWQSATVTSLSRATDLLDSLEAHGVCERELVTTGDENFVVRWR